ncbi:hypothetical protein QJQ45_025606, partial [Haematococcus lacustris]
VNAQTLRVEYAPVIQRSHSSPMHTDWLAFVRSSNEQAPTPATSTSMTNMSEPTWQLLNRGAHRYEDIHPRVPITRDALDVKCQQSKAFDQECKDSRKADRPMQGSSLYVIQQTAALKRVATIAPLTLRVSTHKEAMDAWIGLVGNNGPKLYDVAMLVCWFQAPLEAMLQLNGSCSAVMLNTMKTSAAIGDMMPSSGPAPENSPSHHAMHTPISKPQGVRTSDKATRDHPIHQDVRSSPSGVRYNRPTPFRMDDEDPVEVEPTYVDVRVRRRLQPNMGSPRLDPPTLDSNVRSVRQRTGSMPNTHEPGNQVPPKDVIDVDSDTDS